MGSESLGGGVGGRGGSWKALGGAALGKQFSQHITKMNVPNQISLPFQQTLVIRRLYFVKPANVLSLFGNDYHRFPSVVEYFILVSLLFFS